jgi:RND superfamily putative drug exporter
MFDRLGGLVLRLRFVLVAAWVVAALVFGIFGPPLSRVGSADETSFLPANADSLAARRLIASAFPSDSAASMALIVFARQGGLTDADRTAIGGLARWFEGTDRPAGVARYVSAEGTPSLASQLRSSDGVVELARVDLDSPSFLPETNAAVDAIRAHLAAPGVLPAGLTAQVTGQAGIGRDYLAAIRQGTDRTTLVTIVLVVVVLLLIYRAPLAAMVPLATIGCAFLVSRGLLGFLAQGGWKLSSVLDSFIVVLAFGVGTDYSIFLVSRFREELGRNSYSDAVRVTVSRIGAVIAASAATVIVGLTSMIVASFGMIQTTGPALAIVIAITLAAGLTLTPSLLAIFGRRLFWPRQEQTRVAGSDEKGFWASLARVITTRPGLLAAVVLAGLAAPLLALPQLRQNFDVLQELPQGAESRGGFETLSAHLPQGQLMPLNVLVSDPGANLSTPEELTRVADLEAKIAALPNIQSVSSVVDPNSKGGISDLLRPATQLAAMAQGFARTPSGDLNVQLGDATLSNVQSTVSYLGGLGAAYPKAQGSTLDAALADAKLIEQGLVAWREQANVSNQLKTVIAQIQTAAASGATSADQADVAQLTSYLQELGGALPALKQVAAYDSALAALATLGGGDASSQTVAFLSLVQSLQQMQAWFDTRPAFYFMPSAVMPSSDEQAAQQEVSAASSRLPGELGRLAALFAAGDLYAPPALLSAYVSTAGDVTRLYVTMVTNPYDTASFDTVRQLRTLVAGQASTFGSDARIAVGGSTAEFTDVQTTISSDFQRVAVITIVGILAVLMLLLVALVAPVYLVLTVLLSFSASLSLSAWLLMHVFGQPGLNYFIPLIVFVLLVALGSDYNIFLMARVREESAGRPMRAGIRAASARTGTVITSAGLILAGTFAALITSPLQILLQAGVVVSIGVLVDTFIVRSLLVPAVTAFVGERVWWPWHGRGMKR